MKIHPAVFLPRADQYHRGVDLRLPDRLEQVQRPVHIHLDGHARVLPGQVHRALRGEVKDIRRPDLFQHLHKGGQVQQVHLYQPADGFIRRFLLQVQGRAHKFLALTLQEFAHVPAGKAGGSDYE